MSIAADNVNVRDDRGIYQLFRRGDPLPNWALEKITNPAAIAEGEDAPTRRPIEDTNLPDDGAARADDGLDQLSREQLRQVATERGVSTEGLTRKGELLQALRGE